MTAKWRFLVVGAGAIGTYIGAALAEAGHEVAFLVRERSASHLRKHGIRLEWASGRVTAISQPHIAAFPEKALNSAPYDLVILTLKNYHLPTFLEEISPHAERFPPILSLLNGVEAEALLESALGEGKVIAGTVTTAVARTAVGSAKVERMRGLGIGGGHPLAAKFVEIARAAGLNPRFYPNAAAMKWSKMLANLPANATSAILDMRPSEIFADPALARLEAEQLSEALRVMDALRLPVVNLPKAPVRALAFAVRRLPQPLLRPFMQKTLGSGRGGKMPSFHIDLHSGRGVTEVEALNGAVARSGERLGVPTPVNQALTEILTAIARGESPAEKWRHNPEALIRAVRGNPRTLP